MKKGQTLIANDGLEVALYPLESVRITQSHYGSTSHGSNVVKNTGLWDVTGVTGDTNKGVIYAPFTCKVVALKTGKSSGNQVIVQSINKVHLANGEIDYARFGWGHDNVQDVKLGQTIKQGEKLGDCGDYGYVTGVHSHLMIGVGEWTKGNSIPTCKNRAGSYIYYMPNAIDIDDMFYTNGVREFAKYKTADKITTEGNITDYYISNDKVTCHFKNYEGQSLDLTKFIVDRDESKHQVEITAEIIRARKSPTLDDSSYYGKPMPVGIYNILEETNAENYNWVRVGEDVWFALTGDSYKDLPAKSDEDYKAKYEELLVKYNALEAKETTLNNTIDELNNKLKQIKEILG